MLSWCGDEWQLDCTLLLEPDDEGGGYVIFSTALPGCDSQGEGIALTFL